MSVRWIVFDAVGTVIEPVPDVATVYHAIGARHGSRLSRTEVSDRFRSAFQADESADRATNRLTTDEFLERDRWRRIVNTVLDDVEDPDSCFQDLFDHFGRPGSWQCFDDVTDTLTELFYQPWSKVTSRSKKIDPLPESTGKVAHTTKGTQQI